ncbi:MAG: hypothetical protein AABZ44_00280, partial [Elusimicrobiota bacterium]
GMADLRQFGLRMQQAPAACARMVMNLATYHQEPWQVEVSGASGDKSSARYWDVVNARYWPSRMSARLDPESRRKEFPWMIELGPQARKKAQVFLCKGKNCLLPTRDIAELESFLDVQLPRLTFK